MSKIIISHVDTCLPDYWGGHHLAHFQIPIYPRMTIKDLRREMENELRMGAIGGSSRLAYLLSADMVKPEEEKEADKVVKACYAAIKRVKKTKRGNGFLFKDIETGDDCETCYAFFVIDWED